MSKNLQNSYTSNWNPTKPYLNLPNLPPKADIETIQILKECIKARAELAEVKQAVQLIPNPQILINTLPLLEARASSEIENVVTTTDKLFAYKTNDVNADPATKEALRYSRAMYQGYRLLEKKPLGTSIAEEICSVIKGTEIRVRKSSDTALRNESTGKIIYTPPNGETFIRDLLKNWEQFIHSKDDIDPLIKLAVAHYQFEAIHPFTDGNGRTGRIINSLFLIEQGLLSLPVLYLSRYILRHRSKYNRSLLKITSEGKWEEFIVFLLKGIKETSIWTHEKINAIFNLKEKTAGFVRKEMSKVYSYELITLLFELPYSRINDLVEAGIAQRQTASQYLNDLVSLGVLEEYRPSKEKLFINTRLMYILSNDTNEFADF
ncbi:MAG: protein adenylyltransferase Fic [Pyrinomonadaceae bacterium]